jgi:hypothetical protein
VNAEIPVLAWALSRSATRKPAATDVIWQWREGLKVTSRQSHSIRCCPCTPDFYRVNNTTSTVVYINEWDTARMAGTREAVAMINDRQELQSTTSGSYDWWRDWATFTANTWQLMIIFLVILGEMMVRKLLVGAGFSITRCARAAACPILDYYFLGGSSLD